MTLALIDDGVVVISKDEAVISLEDNKIALTDEDKWFNLRLSKAVAQMTLLWVEMPFPSPFLTPYRLSLRQTKVVG
jgi:hypothetical protein